MCVKNLKIAISLDGEIHAENITMINIILIFTNYSQTKIMLPNLNFINA